MQQQGGGELGRAGRGPELMHWPSWGNAGLSRLPPPGKFTSRDCMLGMEFSGRDVSGKRVMGLVPAEGLATSVLLSQDFLWDVPSSW